MRQLYLLLLAAAVVSAVQIKGFGPPEFETQPLRQSDVKGAMLQANSILQATGAQPQEFAFHTSAKAPEQQPALVEESDRMVKEAPVPQQQAPAALVEESAELHHGVSHHLRSLDGLKLHTKDDVIKQRVLRNVGMSFVLQFVVENFPEELPTDFVSGSPVMVEEEAEVETSDDVNHGEPGRISDRQSRRMWRKTHRGRQRFSEQASRQERGRVPSEAARDAGLPVFLEEASALEQAVRVQPPSSSTVMVELDDAVRAHQKRSGVLEKIRLMSYGSKVDSTADDTEDQQQADDDTVDHSADTESLSGGITPYKMHNTEVDVNEAPKTVEEPRFQQVADKAQAEDTTQAKGFFSAIKNGIRKVAGGVKRLFGFGKKESSQPAKVQNQAAELEDCTGCRMVWKQVELDVGNARYIEDIQASFEHNCMDAQKSTIFYAVCEDMYDDMYALTDDYMSNKYKVVDMCKRGKYCKAG